jgi:hypothetical protein
VLQLSPFVSTDQAGSSGIASDLYAGGAMFESRSGAPTDLAETSRCVSESLLENSGIVSEVGHGRFLPHIIRFSVL